MKVKDLLKATASEKLFIFSGCYCVGYETAETLNEEGNEALLNAFVIQLMERGENEYQVEVEMSQRDAKKAHQDALKKRLKK